MNAFLDLSSVVTRIRGQVPAFKLVAGAAELARALDGLTTTPAAFAVPGPASGGESPYMNQAVEQQVVDQFHVLIAARNLRDDEGAAATDTIRPLRSATLNALLGWAPVGGEFGCEYVGGDLEQFDNAVLWWRDTYRTAYTIRSA